MFISLWWIAGNALRVLEILLLVRVIISWVPHWNRAVWGKLVVVITEPISFPLRRIARIPVAGGIGLDLSPMLALLLIQLARMVLPL